MLSVSSDSDGCRSNGARRLLAYALIGVVAAGIDVGLFVLLHESAGVPPLGAHSISIPLSALFSFTCNAYLNFRTVDRLLLRGAAFAVVVAFGYLLGATIIWLVATLTPFGATAGKLLSLPFVFVLQFALNARVSFRKRKT